jgi:hypothetical protein
MNIVCEPLICELTQVKVIISLLIWSEFKTGTCFPPLPSSQLVRGIIISIFNVEFLHCVVELHTGEQSITHGILMLAWPLYAKQQMNTTMLVKEVGVAIKSALEGGKGVVVREEIERVVRMVMEGEEGKILMRRRAGELKVGAEKVLNISLNGRGAKWF